MCGLLRCSDFLPMAENMGFIKVVHDKEIDEPKKKNFSAALEEGQLKFKNDKKKFKNDGLLVFVYTADDGTLIRHCVQMLFCRDSEWNKNFKFFDCQSENSKKLGDSPVSSLVKIQLVKITENVGNLYDDCGTHLCKDESRVKSDLSTALSNLMRRLPRKRRASVPW